MTELFIDIPIEIKKMIIQYIDYIFDNYDLQTGMKYISEFANSCTVEQQAKFIDFYYYLKLEQVRNEDNSNISEESAREGYSGSNDEEGT